MSARDLPGNWKQDLKGKEHTPAIFRQFSLGLATHRDPWCYNFSHNSVASNMQKMIGNYNAEVEAGATSSTKSNDSTRIAWGGDLPKDLDRSIHHKFDETRIRLGVYRPFCVQSLYFSDSMNERVYQLPQIFPTKAHINIAITIPSGPSAANFIPIMYTLIPALTPNGGNQTFPLYTWEPLSPLPGASPTCSPTWRPPRRASRMGRPRPRPWISRGRSATRSR